MQDTATNHVNSAILLLALFVVGAISFTVWTRNQIPDNIMLHINESWAVMVVGEKDINAVRYNTARFKLEKKNKGNLWLKGYGVIAWQKHKITIRKNAVSFNGQSISRSRHEAIENIMLYADGRISKGKLP